MLISSLLRRCTALLLLFYIPLQAQQMQPAQDGPYKKGVELYQREQYGNAQQLLDKVASADYETDRETRMNATYYAARCAMKLYNGDAEERVENFGQTFELSPLKNKLYLQYANNRFSLKRYSSAAEFYEKVDKYRLNEKERNEYLFKKAYSYMSREKYEKARPLFFDLKDKNSSYSNSARYYYAHLLYKDGKYKEALTNFLPLQDDKSFGKLVPYYLAQIYYKLEDYNKLLEVGEELVDNATASRAPEIAKLVADAFYNKKDYKNTVKYMEMYDEKGGSMGTRDNFELGYSYYQIGNYQAAIQYFNKITGGPDALRQNTYYHLGDSYLKVDKKSQAMTAFKAASEIKASATVREDAWFNYAKLAYETSDPYRDAISTLNSFLNKFPESPRGEQINGLLANLYITTKDYQKAMNAMNRAGSMTPEMKGAYQKIAFYRAIELFNARRYEGALKKYRESLEYSMTPRYTALAHYWIGETQYRLKNYDKALKSYKQFRSAPGSANMKEYDLSFYQTGYCYFKKYDLENAASDFRTFSRSAEEDSKRLPDAYLRLGDSYLLTGGYLVAADFYKDAIQAGTKEIDYALYQRAECLGLDGKKQQKISILQKLISQYPNSVYAEDARYGQAVTYLQLEDYNKALKQLKAFRDDFPGSELTPKATLQMGLVYSNTDRNTQAISTYKGIVKDHPNTQEATEAVSMAKLAYKRQNNIDGYLDWVSGIDFVNFERSTLDSTAYNAAFELYSIDSCQEAIPAFESYLKRFEKGIFAQRAHYYLASCANELNKVAQAQKNYEAILEFPRSQFTAEALLQTARHEYNSENYVNARKKYKSLAEIAEKRPRQLSAHAGVMRTAYKLGDYSEAVIYADLVLGAQSNDQDLVREARLTKARSLYEAGDKQKALPVFDTLAQSSEGAIKAESMYYKATILSQNKKYEESNALINKMIEELPSYKEWKLKALLRMARNFWKLEDIFQANYIFDFILKTDYSEKMNYKAQQMKQDIKDAETQALKEKEEMIKKQSQPIKLDAEGGLQIIDMPEENPADIEKKQ